MSEGETPTIRLKLLDEEIELPYEELGVSASPYSGRPLRKIGIDFDVSAGSSTEVSGALSAARDPENAFVVDGIHWAVSSTSCSYMQDSEIHRHHMELEEIDVPQAERVEMFGLSLEPSRYREEIFDDGVLMISLLTALDEEDDKILEAAIQEASEKEYFNVVRVGVGDEPLRVRFGRCLWEQGDSQRLHLLRLVADEDEPADPGVFGRQHQPELGRAQEKIVALEDTIDLLLRHLVESGSLSKEAEAAVKEGVPDSWVRHFRDFDGAMDVESFF